MSGYTPVFDTVFDGTLCGRWPTLAVWLTILPMADKHGHIDITYQAIATRSGWPLELLKQAIAELMAPDPESRTADCEGRRLELLDPANRQWGWRVVNIQIYRDKASGRNQIDDGRNAAKVKRYRDRHRPTPADTGKHPQTPGTPTHTQTHTQTKDREGLTPPAAQKAKLKPARRAPPDFVPDASIALEKLPHVDLEAEVAKFRDWEFKTPRSDWPAVWRNWVQTAKERGHYAKKAANGEWGRVT